MAYHRKPTTEDWIREAITNSNQEECVAISLAHILTTFNGTAVRDEVHTEKIGPRADSKTLCELFEHKARMYAANLTGVQSFMLLAFYKGESEPKAKHPFRVTGELDFEGLATEGPTETGQRQQGMRLLEALAQGSFRERAHFVDSILRSHEAAARHNATLQENNFQAFEIIRDLMIQMSQQQHEMQIATMNREMATKLVSFIPGLMNTISGSQIFPQSTADTAIIEAIANNIDKDSLEKLVSSGALPNNVVSVLAQRIFDIKKAQDSDRKKLQPQGGIQIKAQSEQQTKNGSPDVHPDDLLGKS